MVETVVDVEAGEDRVKHRNRNRVLLLCTVVVGEADSAVVGELHKRVVGRRVVTGGEMFPANTVQGVRKAAPSTSSEK